MVLLIVLPTRHVVKGPVSFFADNGKTHLEARFLADPVERFAGLLFGTNLTCKSQPTARVYFLSVVIEGACFPADSNAAARDQEKRNALRKLN